jgi:hypothetical protein
MLYCRQANCFAESLFIAERATQQNKLTIGKEAFITIASVMLRFMINNTKCFLSLTRHSKTTWVLYGQASRSISTG